MSETTEAQQEEGSRGVVKPVRTASGLLAAMRPKQWIKNIIVFSAPLASGQFFNQHVLLHSALAFVVFTLGAAGTYLINDAKDVHSDRLHPKKRFRPIASGVVPVPLAFGFGALLMAAGVGLSFLSSPALAGVIAAYCAIQLAYCFWLKNQPVLEMCCVASGFLLRAITGGVAAQLPLSPWFLLVIGFGSLYLVAGKRHSERVLMDNEDQMLTRKVLTYYSASYLRFVWALAATVMIVMYALWALTGRLSGSVWSGISLVPFVLAILRYAVDVDNAEAGAPEDSLLGDKVLPALGILWAATVFMAVYVG